jgi:hypothetical protein
MEANIVVNAASVPKHLIDERFHLCLIESRLVGHDVSPF